MKKAISIFVIILLFFILYFFQANFFTWFNISGVMPNLFIIYVLFIGLFAKNKMGIIFGTIFGLYLDFIFGRTIGISAVLLAAVGFLGEILSKNFSKDSRFTMMVMVIIATFGYEILSYLFVVAKGDALVEILGFVKILLVEVFFNAILTVIFYPLIKKLGYKLENIYEEKVMITRFF